MTACGREFDHLSLLSNFQRPGSSRRPGRLFVRALALSPIIWYGSPHGRTFWQASTFMARDTDPGFLSKETIMHGGGTANLWPVDFDLDGGTII